MPEEILETPQPVQPIEPKPTNWLKIVLAAVLGLGLLAGAAYAGYWYGTESANLKTQSAKPTTVSQPTPTPESTTPSVTDPTANWKTYNNEEYGYSFRYPNNGVLEQGGPIQNIELRVGASLPTGGDVKYIDMGFWVSVVGRIPKSSSSAVATAYHNHDRAFLISPDIKFSDITSLRLFGSEAYTFDDKEPGCPDQGAYCEKISHYFVSNSKYVFHLNEVYGISRTGDVINKETTDQILSTFKFLD